jgi:hypothetical protein
MNPNSAGYAAMQQQHHQQQQQQQQHLHQQQQQQQQQQHQNSMMAAAAAGYPMQTGSPANQQFPFYANNNPMAAGYPQMRPGSVQQQMHSFNGMPTQTTGGMMPANMSGTYQSYLSVCAPCCGVICISA